LPVELQLQAPFPGQSQQFIPAFDLDVSPKWEINFGLGVGVTAATDHMSFKTIIGRRFDWGHRHDSKPSPTSQPQQDAEMYFRLQKALCSQSCCAYCSFKTLGGFPGLADEQVVMCRKWALQVEPRL